MKKTVLPLVLAIVLCLSLFGCMKPSPEAIAEKVAKFAELNSSALDEMNGQFEGVMRFGLNAEGSELIYRFDSVVEGFLTWESCRSIINKNGEDYIKLYESLKTYAGSEDVRLVLRFCEPDGSLLYEQWIDRNFRPDPSLIIETDPQAQTLEGYIGGAEFQTQIAGGNTDEITVHAAVEDGNVVVILYELSAEIDRAYLDQVRANWDQSFGEGETAESLATTLKALRALFPDDGVILKVRATDPTREILWEKTFE